MQTSSPDTSGEIEVEPGPGEPFVDPQGTYTINIDPDWADISGTFVAEVEAWSVAIPEDGFGANVNVLTQLVPGMNLDEYTEMSQQNMGSFELVDNGTVVGTNGNEIGWMEFVGTPPGVAVGVELHFLAYFAVKGGHAVVATLATLEDDFDELRAEIEPYLLTLQAS